MTTVRREPGGTRKARGEQPSDAGSSHPCDGSPVAAHLGRLFLRTSTGASCVGLIWLLPDTLVAGITKAVVFVVVCVLLFLSAVLFAEQPEPYKRLVRIIKALRNLTSDR